MAAILTDLDYLHHMLAGSVPTCAFHCSWTITCAWHKYGCLIKDKGIMFHVSYLIDPRVCSGMLSSLLSLHRMSSPHTRTYCSTCVSSCSRSSCPIHKSAPHLRHRQPRVFHPQHRSRIHTHLHTGHAARILPLVSQANLSRLRQACRLDREIAPTPAHDNDSLPQARVVQANKYFSVQAYKVLILITGPLSVHR